MRTSSSLFLAVAVCLSLGLIVNALASDRTLPPSDELIKKFIQRSQEEDAQKLDEKYGFIEHRIHYELDKNDNAKEKRDETFQLVMLDGHPFHRMIAKDGKPLSAEEHSKAAEREKKFLDEQYKKGKKKSGDDGENLKMDEQFIKHFKFDVVGREELNGRPSYIVTVLPTPGNLSVRNNAEKVFSHMQGKVWVDAQDYALVKCDVHLTEPTSFYGILGSLSQLDLLLQRRFIEKNVWVPEKINIAIDGRKLFTSMRMRQSSEFSDFKKIGP